MANIIISPYNPEWPNLFETEKLRLQKIMADYIEGEIAHVGSTSVPGLSAKPTIDIMLGVHSLEASQSAIPKLEKAGYCYYPYKPDVMHWFCAPSPEVRHFHLHLVPFQSPLWHERIQFRNLLRTDPKLAAEYQALKHALAAQDSKDREAYTQGKWPFIQDALNKRHSR